MTEIKYHTILIKPEWSSEELSPEALDRLREIMRAKALALDMTAFPTYMPPPTKTTYWKDWPQPRRCCYGIMHRPDCKFSVVT